MKAYLILLHLILTAAALEAQDLFSEVNLPIASRMKIDGIAVHDSLLVNIQDEAFESNWILPSGETKAVDLTELRNKQLCAVMNAKDSIYYYYFEANKKNVEVRALVQDKITQAKKVSNKRIVLQGTLLGAYTETDLYLISCRKNDYTITLSRVRNLDIVEQRLFMLPSDPLKNGKNEIAFILEDAAVRPRQASEAIKIYKEGSAIYLSVDSPYDLNEPNHTMFTSTITRLDLITGKSEVKTFIETSQHQFRTYVTDNLVFKVCDNRGFDISVFHFDTNKLVASLRIDKTSAPKEQKAFLSNGNTNKVSKNRSVWQAINSSGTCFITATKVDSAYIIKLGTHAMVTSSVGPPVLSQLGPLFLLATVSANIAVLAMTDAQSIDHFFYLKMDDGNFKYTDVPEAINQKIDAHEINETKALEYKGHINTKNISYGLYKSLEGVTLRIVKFTKR